MQRTISTCCRLPGSHTSTQSAPSGFPGGSMAKNLPAKAGDGVRSLGREGLLEKRMATHSSTLAWEILVGCSPWGRREPDTTKQQQGSLLPALGGSVCPRGRPLRRPQTAQRELRSRVSAAPPRASPRLWHALAAPASGAGTCIALISASAVPWLSLGSLSCLLSARTLVTQFRAALLQYGFP